MAAASDEGAREPAAGKEAETAAEPDAPMAATSEEGAGEPAAGKEKEQSTEDGQSKPEAPVEGTEQAVGAPDAPAPVERKPSAAKVSASRKKAAPRGPDLDSMAFKIKTLQDEARQKDAAAEARQKQIQELEAEKAALISEAQAKRAAAQKVSQEYIRRQCEAALAKLEGDIPKKPMNAYLMFCSDNTMPGIPTNEQNKKRTELWKNIAPEDKKKYTDRYEAEATRFREWGASEEGQKNLQERTECVRKIKLTGEEELAKALGKNLEASTVSPVKRTATAPSQETPAKHRKVTPTELALDEKVVEEAGKADLLAQLKNLAARPDVAALGKSSQEIWHALKSSSGMVNAAKRALVGA